MCATSPETAPNAPDCAPIPARPPVSQRDVGRVASTPRRRSVAGFTLLEVLIALAVLGVCLLAIYQGYSTVLAIATGTRKLWTAMEYTHNELARFERMSPSPDVSVSQGEFPRDDPMTGYAWKREITDLEPLPSVKVRRVQIEITWTFGTATQAYQSSLYVLPH
jgi:general secretion pathway protein I